jgi:hypothetical protein
LSPQTRRGRATPTSNRKSSARQRIEAERKATRPAQPSEEDANSIQEVEYEAPHRGILYRAQHSSMLKSFYAYTRVYIPFVLVFIVLLGGVFVYKQVNPDVSLADHWRAIQNQYSPKCAAAEDALNNDFTDFTKTVTDYGDLKVCVEGMLNAVGYAKDWGPATTAMQSFITDTTSYVSVLTTAASAATQSDLDAVSSAISGYNQTIATEIATVNLALGLSALGQPTLAPGVTASPSPTPAPSESSSASASVSASASASASASVSASASASASAGAS